MLLNIRLCIASHTYYYECDEITLENLDDLLKSENEIIVKGYIGHNYDFDESNHNLFVNGIKGSNNDIIAVAFEKLLLKYRPDYDSIFDQNGKQDIINFLEKYIYFKTKGFNNKVCYLDNYIKFDQNKKLKEILINMLGFSLGTADQNEVLKWLS